MGTDHTTWCIEQPQVPTCRLLSLSMEPLQKKEKIYKSNNTNNECSFYRSNVVAMYEFFNNNFQKKKTNTKMEPCTFALDGNFNLGLQCSLCVFLGGESWVWFWSVDLCFSLRSKQSQYKIESNLMSLITLSQIIGPKEKSNSISDQKNLPNDIKINTTLNPFQIQHIRESSNTLAYTRECSPQSLSKRKEPKIVPINS